jgi:hypothetical protein
MSSPPPPPSSQNNGASLNVEAKLFVPGVGSVTPPPKEKTKKKTKNEEEEEALMKSTISPLNWQLNDANEHLEFTPPPSSARDDNNNNNENTNNNNKEGVAVVAEVKKEPPVVVAFTPARGPVKKRVDDPFDREIYLQSAVKLVKEEFAAAAAAAASAAAATVSSASSNEKEGKEDAKKKNRRKKKKMNEAKIDADGVGEGVEEKMSGSSMPLLSSPSSSRVSIPTSARMTTMEKPLVEVVPAASSEEDEEPTPRESKMLSKPLLFNEQHNSDDEYGENTGVLVNEYGTQQPQKVEHLFPEESRVPLLAISAKTKREEQYGANEEEDVPDEKLWTKETLAPLLGGGLNSIKTVNTRTGEEDKEEELVKSAKLTFTNYGADDENVVADWGDAKVPLLSASAGSTPRYLDGGGGLLSRQGPFSYGTATTDEVEERVASSSSSSGGYSSESESSSSDDDDDDEDGKENRQHSAKLLLEQFLMSEKKEKKRPTEMGYKQSGTNGIASTRARETTTSKSIQFKPLLKTPPRLKKVAHHHQEQPPQQKSQTTQTERELRSQNTSSPYTPLTTHAAEQRKNALRNDLCCVFHAVLVSRPEIIEKHLALSSASPYSSLRNRVASLEPRRSTRRRLDRFEANVESFMVFALGEEEDKEHKQFVSFDAFARAMRVAATAAARMTTLEGVRDAVSILSDFESLFTQDSAYSSIVRECLMSSANADQIYRHRCSRRLRAYKSIISILNKIKRYDQKRHVQESNITVDRICLLLAAVDDADDESESQEEHITTTTTTHDDDARYVFHLVSSANRKLSAEVEGSDAYDRVHENNGYKINSSRYNSTTSSSNSTMPLSEVIARRRRMVDAWFETQRF